MVNTAFFSGQGSAAFIGMLNESYAHFVPSAHIPNLSMLIDPGRDTFTEGFFWRGFWIQNSYGFGLASVPFLREPFFSLLQNSLDLYWDRIGDGMRTGYDSDDDEVKGNNFGLWQLVGPDGCLGDCVSAGGSIAYKQGDGWQKHDWFYEATAAGLVMQAELLLRKRDIGEVKKYLPKMLRSCDFIERARDANGLFLVGPGCDLLAPSFGAVWNKNGKMEKSYLAGLTITYSGALMRMLELCRLAGEEDTCKLLEQRLAQNMASLPLLLTDEGYFVKSLETNGTKHGVYAAERFGYFESVVSVDAIALGVADRNTAESILQKIASIEGLRPAGFLPKNYPGLDDTYKNYGSAYMDDRYWNPGDWVNGGCWGTVEGRAILAYLKLGRFEDAAASVKQAYEWTKNYRMDAPWCQYGVNTHNEWSDRENQPEVSVMIDNFAIPAALLRGIFEYEYTADTLKLTPHLPACIQCLSQKVPIFWGGKELYISCANGAAITGLTIDGRPADCFDDGCVWLRFDDLAQVSSVCIEMDGEKPEPPTQISAQGKDWLVRACAEALEKRKNTPLDSTSQTLRPMTEAKKEQIIQLYRQALLRAEKLLKEDTQ